MTDVWQIRTDVNQEEYDKFHARFSFGDASDHACDYLYKLTSDNIVSLWGSKGHV